MGVEFDALRDPEPGLLIDYSEETAGLNNRREPETRNVEITDVQTTIVDGNFDWTLVRVYTDAGVTGTGEAYWGTGVPAIIEAMKPYLLGENPLDIDRLYTHLVQRTSGEGSIAGQVVTAVSGVEIALHDLAGKLLNVPAYQLLGGKYRDEVRVYCDTHAGAHGADSDTAEHSEVYEPAAYAAATEAVVDEGFDALKFDLDVPSGLELDRMNRYLSDRELQHKVDIVEAATEAAGNRADVAFDCHWSWSADSTVRLANAVEEYPVWWLEDPVPPENIDIHGTVTRNTRTTICAGENVYRKAGTRRLVETQAVDILQPDLPKVGGMRETRKIADQAETYHIPLALHNVASPVGTMASAQAATAVPNFLALEWHARAIDWWEDLVEESVIEDGRIEIPEEPGLGVTLDLDAVAEHMAPGETLFDEA
jgi:L-alanine-DL-glutamate epimerase-like enolase superfamily enzyme